MVDGRRRADDVHVASVPVARCTDCRFEWHSHAMADGLRLLGSCPKCGGELVFAADRPAPERHDAPRLDRRAPHLVLGVPRR